jgi:ClpP class serine protease
MGGGELIWIVIVLLMVMPVLQRRLLSWKRQSQIATLESERNSRVIMLVHRQETMKFLGIPLMRYIDVNDAEEILNAIKMTDDDVPIDLVLHTPGGLVLASMQIARALEHHPAKVTVHVPYYAMSGGTLIALAADEITMSDHAVLGPVDPQLGDKPAVSIRRVTSVKPVEEIDDETLIYDDVARKAIRQVHSEVARLLPEELSSEDAETLSKILTHGAWTHDYPLFPDTLDSFGLNVTTDIPESVIELMKLYPQPNRQSDGVDYVPTPYRSEPAEAENTSQGNWS